MSVWRLKVALNCVILLRFNGSAVNGDAFHSLHTIAPNIRAIPPTAPSIIAPHSIAPDINAVPTTAPDIHALHSLWSNIGPEGQQTVALP